MDASVPPTAPTGTAVPQNTSKRPGIVSGRPDPYVFAAHSVALRMARLIDATVTETSSYTIKHDDLWTLQQNAEKAVRALWDGISKHAVHCHGCDTTPPTVADDNQQPS